jgi:hypothetical protein
MGADAHMVIERYLEGIDLTGLSVVEIGSRHQDKGPGSTNQFHAYCVRKGAEFWTIDSDPAVANGCKAVTPNAVCARGEDFLATFPGKPIVFAYLDNFDWTYAGVERVPKVIRQAEHYRTVHMIERTNTNSQIAHLQQARALLNCIHTTAFVLFDDTWLTLEGGHDGKGGTAVPFLLENGFRVMEQGLSTDPYILLEKQPLPTLQKKPTYQDEGQAGDTAGVPVRGDPE